MPVLPDFPSQSAGVFSPVGFPHVCIVGGGGLTHAILDENIQTLFDREGGIEDNEAKTQREDVVTVADFQEIANGTLFDAALVKIWMCGSPATS